MTTQHQPVELSNKQINKQTIERNDEKQNRSTVGLVQSQNPQSDTKCM